MKQVSTKYPPGTLLQNIHNPNVFRVIPALYKNLKHLKVLDSYDGIIKHWQVTYFDGSDYSIRKDLEIVVLEDEEEE